MSEDCAQNLTVPASGARVVAVIPARGGSKGIPRKNLLPLAGHPLLAWSIFAAIEARHVDRVIVSTDDAEIAAVARDYGAEVVLRPAEISGDKAPSEAALMHVLDHLAQQDCHPELLVFLQATSPLRRGMDVDGTIESLRAEQADSCFSACAEHFTGRWRRTSEGSVEPVNFRPRSRPMRQDYPLEYLENGSIYVMRPELLRRTGSRMGGRITVYPMNPVQSLQLDEPEDVALIEACMAALSIPGPQLPALRRLRESRLLVFDFDGIFTDNLVYVSSSGEESVCCSRADSLGLDYLKRAGLAMLVLSTETNPVVAQRCRKLGLECFPGQGDKLVTLHSILAQRGLQPEQVAYMGNDLNDLACMAHVGLAIAPADAHPAVLRIAHLVTDKAGGRGAIRQVAQWYLGHDSMA
ncbi:acylneuraminate cytidylyltransferase [Pseudomonas sp. NCCP-436]|uniref:acylneuraminate cytidylyltransferase n=1 Tax=Pseudomonas sp. NCCP-436 TaxID=2842481 RepID=UPI001C7EE428|nr:acylneuraminate cytidylyltransferase [Pseudomonas sp. NCCP-436]GIZ12200.1 transferase [Pseudomonas sp. NCCP-436]